VAFRVRVEGVREVVATLNRFGATSEDLKEAFARIGAVVKSDALVLVPVLSGRLKSTIRAGRSKSRATVRAGRAGLDRETGYNYAAIQHYGGMASGKYGPHYIQPKPFLVIAAQQNAGYARNTLDNELGDLIDRLGLNDLR
jgi:hypothetical protein